MVHLASFEVYNLVALIFLDVQHHFLFKDQFNDVVVPRLQQLENVFSVQLEVGIVDDGLFEFAILTHFCNYPSVVYKLASFLELWVHHNRHEVVVHDDAFEHVSHVVFEGVLFGFLHLLETILSSALLLLLLIDLLLDECLERVEQTLVPVGTGEVGNGHSVLDLLEQVFVVFDGLLGNSIIHGRHRHTMDLLDDGVGLLELLVLSFLVILIFLLLPVLVTGRSEVLRIVRIFLNIFEVVLRRLFHLLFARDFSFKL